MINLSFGHIKDSFFDSRYIKKTIKKGLKTLDYSNYSTPGGSKTLREKIVENFSDNLSYENCCTSVSTNLSFYILNKIIGKSVLAISPIYSNFHKQILLNSQSFYEENYENFSQKNIDYKKYTDSVCVLVYPNNPTGELCDIETLELNVKKMKENGIVCIIDVSWINSIYHDTELVNIKTLTNFVKKYDSIVLLGFTKIFGVTSIRCSGVLAPGQIIEKFINLHDILAVSCGQMDEFLVGSFIDKTPIDWNSVRKDLREKIKFVIKKLESSDLDIKYILPKAGIFLYFRLNNPVDVNKVVFECKQRGLLVYSSKDFENTKSGFRISINNSFDELDKGLNILFETIRKNII